MWWGAAVPASTDLKHESDQVTHEPKLPLTPNCSQDEVPAPPPGMKCVLWPAPLGSEHPPVPNTPSDLWMCCLFSCLWALAHAVPAALKFLSYSSETSHSIFNTPSPRKPLLTPKFVLSSCQSLWLVCGPQKKWLPCSPVLSTQQMHADCWINDWMGLPFEPVHSSFILLLTSFLSISLSLLKA